jgi:hypothetical protein
MLQVDLSKTRKVSSRYDGFQVVRHNKAMDLLQVFYQWANMEDRREAMQILDDLKSFCTFISCALPAVHDSSRKHRTRMTNDGSALCRGRRPRHMTIQIAPDVSAFVWVC